MKNKEGILADHYVKKFSEIDFLSIDPSNDRVILPTKEVYIFSDSMCDFCWTGGQAAPGRSGASSQRPA